MTVMMMNMVSQNNADRDRLLSFDQIAKILTICRDRSEKDLSYGRKSWVTRSMLVNLVFKSGLKVGEISRLRIQDLRLSEPAPCILVGDGNGGSCRSVFIYPALVDHIEYYLNLRRFSWGEELDNGQCLLAHKAGVEYTTAALNFSFKKAVEIAGIQAKFTIQDARHSYAVLLLAKTSDLQFVKSQLGHAKKSSTAKYLDFRSYYSKGAALQILS